MMLRFPRPTDSHEAWFGQHYADLLQWAARITGGDRSEAEDLVHDVFVHFMASRPDLSAIENIDGYLYTSLRNLHLSNARRAARRQETVVAFADFEVLDYESLRSSLRVVQELHATDMREEFQHQLRAIWRYAHVRKHSSKTASVLMLRFFHGYYPEEIAVILRVSREASDQLLRRARKEAHLFIVDPQSVSYADETALAKAWPADGLLSPPDLAMALHDAALQSDSASACLGATDLAALYAPADGDKDPSVSTPTLAHIVSCRACLGRVTRVLDLPPLADRHPLDSLGYDRDSKPPRGGLGGGSGATGGGKRSAECRRLDAGRRRLSDLLAQEPKELRVSVNGVILGSQQITSAVSRQTLRLTGQALDFLEIFSEQDVRLLFVSLDPPPHGPVEVHETIALNEGRRLEARVNFAGASPVVHVSYVDPARAPAPVTAPTSPVTMPSRRSMSALRRWASRLVGPSGWIDPSRWRLTRGGAFTTLVVATTIAAVLLNQLGRPALSAAELLQKSSAVDAVWQADRAHAVYRTVEMEASSTATGATTRRRVEVWHSAARGLTVRRAYDDRNQLLAGEWIEADGARTVHRNVASTDGEPALQGLEAWRFDPSAADFTRLVGAVDGAVVAKDRDRFRVSFDNSVTPSDPMLLSAAIILRDDWRAVAQRVIVRTDSGTTEFTWTERSWTTHPAETVPAAVFEIDPSLAAVATPPAAAPTTIPPATATLELAALTALRRIDADLGEEVRVRRVDGRLDVSGVVASTERQAEIRSVLADVTRDPAVRLRIDTVDEVHARARRQGMPVPIETNDGPQPLVFGPQQIPVHAEIRQYLLTTGVPAPDADAEVVRIAYRILQRANRMRVHAWALRSVLEQISAVDVDRMGPRGRQQWRTLVGEHGRRFGQEAAALRALLASVFPAGVPPNTMTAAGERLQNDEQVRQASQQFVEMAAAVDRQLKAAVTLSVATVRASAAPLDPARLWTTFEQASALAASLDRSAQSFDPQQP